MNTQVDPTDYSYAVKRRGSPPKPWRWEIYRAGKSDPVMRSTVFFATMAQAAKEGKKAGGLPSPTSGAALFLMCAFTSALDLGRIPLCKRHVRFGSKEDFFNFHFVYSGCEQLCVIWI